ncbi:MAG: energy transducer TonB [Acidimicrobiia bacterium]|nr:energy transducer TonB [Acidimicrobiia bacterium]
MLPQTIVCRPDSERGQEGSVLFTSPPVPRRSPLAALASIALHLAVAGAVSVIGARELFSPRLTAGAEELTYVMFAEPRLVLPAQPAPAAAPEPVRLAAPEPVRLAAPEPSPAPTIEPVKVPSEPSPPPPPASPRPVRPVAPESFVEQAAALSEPPAARPIVRDAGFDAAGPAGSGSRMQLPPARTGLFASGGGGSVGREAAGREGTVTGVFGAAGDASANVTRPSATGQAVADAGFSSQPSPAEPAGPGRSLVESTGFEDARRAGSGPDQTAPSKPAPPPPTPLEVLSKPTPRYTDEARERRIQGEVVLDVVFTAEKEVRVLGVVSGLGYGLDARAEEAARRIEFTPATRGGVPIDVRTRVTIVFRLS